MEVLNKVVSNHGGGSGPLAVFLRARRRQVRPEQHRLAPGVRRQVPGLRRDEVAVLAGISTDYYVRLEQGRERRPSRTVVDGLCEALLLDPAAARHLRALAAGEAVANTAAPGMDRTRSADVHRLLDSMTMPALLMNRWLDIVGSNAPGALLYEGLEPRDNYARMVFLAPQAPSFFVDWPELAHCMVAALRAQAGYESGASRLTELVDELAAHSAEFTASWNTHHVYEKAMERKLLRHPRVGPLTLHQHVLELPGSEGHSIWAHHPADAATSNALPRLRHPRD
ncbi:helix-turn-helix transcriptional regulator [Streptomyces sp. WZ-12]|uniref:helix-turn-helix transcriptional regulator n=1 Tax=Streptomyces sp. WZ-12 TaxID=3030210 RepID=UPI002380D471|nr:helix-turn-helix transcriptional regulator [Streptomyces sp. WZ-12]